MPEQFLVTAYPHFDHDTEEAVMDVAYSHDEAVKMKTELHEEGYPQVDIEPI